MGARETVLGAAMPSGLDLGAEQPHFPACAHHRLLVEAARVGAAALQEFQALTVADGPAAAVGVGQDAAVQQHLALLRRQRRRRRGQNGRIACCGDEAGACDADGPSISAGWGHNQEHTHAERLPCLQQAARHNLLHASVDAAVQLQPRAVQEEAAAVVVGGAALAQVQVWQGGGARGGVGWGVVGLG